MCVLATARRCGRGNASPAAPPIAEKRPRAAAVPCIAARSQFSQLARMIHQHAAARETRYLGAKGCEQRRLRYARSHLSRFHPAVGALDRRARLHLTARVDMVADTGRRRTERVAVMIPVGIDDHEAFAARSLLQQKMAQGTHLFVIECLFKTGHRTGGTVDVVPEIVCTARGHVVNEAFRHHICIGGDRHTGRDTRHQSLFLAARQRVEGTSVGAAVATPIRIGIGSAFHADERRHVSGTPQPRGQLFVKQLSVGEKLEVDVAMALENLAAMAAATARPQNAEKRQPWHGSR